MNHLPEIIVFFKVFELHNVRMIKKLMTLLIISDFSVKIIFRVHKSYSLDCNFFAFEGSSEDLTISSMTDEIALINPHVTNIDETTNEYSFVVAIIVLLNNNR